MTKYKKPLSNQISEKQNTGWKDATPEQILSDVKHWKAKIHTQHKESHYTHILHTVPAAYWSVVCVCGWLSKPMPSYYAAKHLEKLHHAAFSQPTPLSHDDPESEQWDG